MELRVEDNEIICGLNPLLQLPLLFSEVPLLRENPPSTAANSTTQFWITASTIFRHSNLNLSLSGRELLCDRGGDNEGEVTR